MRIDTPSLRADDFKVDLNTGYGNPWGDILLTEDGRTRLQWVNEDDCDQIIKAAAELKSQIIASRTRAAAPHGRGHLHKGRCQLCGKPEDDELHGEPAPVITDSERTCPENHPESGLWCYRNGDHGVHRDADGEEWRTDSPDPLGPVGRLVILTTDDSSCPVVGRVVGQVDEDTLEVLWGERQFEDNPGTGSYEPFDSLSPAPKAAGQ